MTDKKDAGAKKPAKDQNEGRPAPNADPSMPDGRPETTGPADGHVPIDER